MINISLLQYIYNVGQISSSSSKCNPQCDGKSEACIVFTLIKFWKQNDLFIPKKFTQNNFKREIKEFVKAHEKMLKLKALTETEFLVCVNY